MLAQLYPDGFLSTGCGPDIIHYLYLFTYTRFVTIYSNLSLGATTGPQVRTLIEIQYLIVLKMGVLFYLACALTQVNSLGVPWGKGGLHH